VGQEASWSISPPLEEPQEEEEDVQGVEEDGRGEERGRFEVGPGPEALEVDRGRRHFEAILMGIRWPWQFS